MQERLDYGNEHEPRQDEYQDDDLSWRLREYQSYHRQDVEDLYDDYEDEGDFGEDHEDDFAQDDAADYQEQYEPGDTAGAGYAATRFSECLRRGRGLIEGEKWRPPYERDRFMPVFVRLKDLRRAAFSFHQVEADTMGRGGKRPHHGRETAGLTSSPVLASSNHRASDSAGAGVAAAQHSQHRHQRRRGHVSR